MSGFKNGIGHPPWNCFLCVSGLSKGVMGATCWEGGDKQLHGAVLSLETQALMPLGKLYQGVIWNFITDVYVSEAITTLLWSHVLMDRWTQE